MSAFGDTKGQVPDFTEIDERPYVAAYVQKPKFNVGDEVYLLDSDGTRKGPYLVASLPSTGKCTLSLANGSPVKNGAEVSTSDVEAA
ncbi:hypothetical protein NPX13_g2819 [Xylaria arbuscula]|uniref:Uncharacterized protein n=1 Tax=Xylaria arbuscula TaxID=114810 RepID=A0A9W8TQ43_9PEZI|nr:hypothetical protein NPX13_g2819 [Xylaria arbuscula]